tara:strand:- start:2410 stop:3195 length:786 start_codon:yes stop_codon:yes gene_type:complete
MGIPRIYIQRTPIGRIDVPDVTNWLTAPMPSFFNKSPVTTQIGFPIVDIPGCVETRNNQSNRSLPDDDPKGNLVLCDGNVPSYNPINFEPERIIITKPAPVPKTETPSSKTPEIKPPKIPKDIVPPTKVDCPSPKQLAEEPVGFIFDSGRKKITGYRLEGNQCIRLVEDVPIPEQVINAVPPIGTVITTAGIAAVATTSALLAKPFADLLLRVVKPVTKKIIKKIASIRGKKVKVESVEERRVAQRDRNHAILALRRALRK